MPCSIQALLLASASSLFQTPGPGRPGTYSSYCTLLASRHAVLSPHREAQETAMDHLAFDGAAAFTLSLPCPFPARVRVEHMAPAYCALRTLPALSGVRTPHRTPYAQFARACKPFRVSRVRGTGLSPITCSILRVSRKQGRSRASIRNLCGRQHGAGARPFACSHPGFDRMQLRPSSYLPLRKATRWQIK